MLQASSDQQSLESLSQLRVQICSVRLSSSTKLVDICVIMEIDEKYTYRTEIIPKPNKSNALTDSLIKINETFDTLVNVDSNINFKIHAPTRFFGANDIGHVKVTLKSIIDDYQLKQSNNGTENSSPLYRVQLPFQNSSTSSSLFRSNDNSNNSSTGMIEVIFHGSILKQGRPQQSNQTASQSVDEIVERKIHQLVVCLACRIHRLFQKIQAMKPMTILKRILLLMKLD